MSYNEIDFHACASLAHAESQFEDCKYYGERLTGSTDQLRTVFDKYVRPLDKVAEFGVQKCVSSVLLLQRCARLHSWEIGTNRKEQQAAVVALAEGRWTLTYGDSRKSKLPDVDVLFIDSSHFYQCTRDELFHAAPKVGRYIILHDTTTHWWTVRDEPKGIGHAVREFMEVNPWRILERFWPAPGVMVLGR